MADFLHSFVNLFVSIAFLILQLLDVFHRLLNVLVILLFKVSALRYAVKILLPCFGDFLHLLRVFVGIGNLRAEQRHEFCDDIAFGGCRLKQRCRAWVCREHLHYFALVILQPLQFVVVIVVIIVDGSVNLLVVSELLVGIFPLQPLEKGFSFAFNLFILRVFHIDLLCLYSYLPKVTPIVLAISLFY